MLKNGRTRTQITIAATVVLALAAAPAQAYIGPGAGLGAIGTLVALMGAVLLAIVGFVWYPIKRMFRKKPSTAHGSESAAQGETPKEEHETVRAERLRAQK